jgi:hypothetical protein
VSSHVQEPGSHATARLSTVDADAFDGKELDPRLLDAEQIDGKPMGYYYSALLRY